MGDREEPTRAEPPVHEGTAPAAAPVPVQVLALGGPRCPYCHGGIALEGRVWLACERCLARHHRGCWLDGRRCATCGEERAIGPRPDRSRSADGRRRRHLRLSLAALSVAALGATGGALFVLRRGDPGALSAALAEERARAHGLAGRLDEERGRAARGRCALALWRHGHADLAAPLAAWDGHDGPAAHALRNRIGWLLLSLQRSADPAGRELCQVLEDDLPAALGTR